MGLPVGVPTVNRMKSAFGSYALGGLGGLIYSFSNNIFGSGLIGSLVAPVLAGSLIKGETGTALATTAGFLTFSGIGSGAAASVPASSATTDTRGTL